MCLHMVHAYMLACACVYTILLKLKLGLCCCHLSDDNNLIIDDNQIIADDYNFYCSVKNDDTLEWELPRTGYKNKGYINVLSKQTHPNISLGMICSEWVLFVDTNLNAI